ncbi:MAG: hypothetical protein CME25_10565 [Gemmatimonadetes bacterium]|nr:hypothetical protein [Gemmatimonadota bacterium]|tara:strand:+ start:3657 stop:4124 length:468 start_codon:yes stop_codon:yes gene_type:complete
MDYIDILFFHSPFGHAEIEDDVWQALDDLRNSGKIRFAGHSISKLEDTRGMAEHWAGERKIDVVQVVYSLMNREASGLISQPGEQVIGVVARESLANGFLSGVIARETEFPKNNLNAPYSRDEIDECVSYVEHLENPLKKYIQTITQESLIWFFG